MMKFTFWPDLVDWPIKVSVSGDVLTVNDESIDLSVIPEGYRLPGSATGNKFFIESEYVERLDGVLYVNLRLPVSWDSPEEYRNPVTPLVINVADGDVLLPDTTPPQPQPVNVDLEIPEPEKEEPVYGSESIEENSGADGFGSTDVVPSGYTLPPIDGLDGNPATGNDEGGASSGIEETSGSPGTSDRGDQ